MLRGRGPPPWDPKNMKIHVFDYFLSVLGPPKAPRSMPEDMAVDPESIRPRGSMATPFSPDLMFSESRFGCSRNQKSGPIKNQIWPESGRHGFVCRDTWCKLIGGCPRTFGTGPWAPKRCGKAAPGAVYTCRHPPRDL